MRNYRHQFCAILELLSEQGLPHFSVDKLESFLQLISNEICNCIPNILWICFQVFELRYLYLLRSAQFFNPHGGFPLIILVLVMLHCLLFKIWKAIDSLTRMTNFLFREFYLNLLFKLNIGPSLSLSDVVHVSYYANNFSHN